MTEQVTIFARMRDAAQSTASHNASVIVILRDAGNDEATIDKLRHEYLIGTVMGRCDLGDNAAIDYLPVMGAKPGTKGKWSDFPIKEPTTFDPAKHRPLAVHHAYRGGLANWSNIRASAGLASLRTATTRAAQTMPAGADKAVPVTLETFAVPKTCDAALATELVVNFDTLLTDTLKKHAATIKGDAGSILRKVCDDLHAYVGDLASALQRDREAAPKASILAAIENTETAKALEETRALLATMRAELVEAREREAKAAQPTAPKRQRQAKAA